MKLIFNVVNGLNGEVSYNVTVRARVLLKRSGFELLAVNCWLSENDFC